MTQQEAYNPSLNNYANGVMFEEKAKRLIEEKGYQIIKIRYKNHFGEIDIIATHKYLQENSLKNGLNFKISRQCLVFFEVKSRQNDELIESILRTPQIKRIKNSALYFIAQNTEYQNHDIRFDFILFDKKKEVTHFENYF